MKLIDYDGNEVKVNDIVTSFLGGKFRVVRIPDRFSKTINVEDLNRGIIVAAYPSSFGCALQPPDNPIG